MLEEKIRNKTAGMSQKTNKPGMITVRDTVIIADELGVTLEEFLDDQAMIEEIDRQRKEAGLLKELSQRLQSSSKESNNLSPSQFKVPPVGLEPTTHDLKGRCSNH